MKEGVEMVEVFERSVRPQAISSSKGNQLKWENDNVWYKADYMGYEGLAEYVVSHMLCKSSLNKKEIVIYEPEQIKYKRIVYQGVKSNSFINGEQQIVTLERLFRITRNESLSEEIWHIHDTEQRLKFLVEQIEQITGLKEFGIYMNRLFTIDAIFLNEDRHMHNIAVLMDGKGKFEYCPIFDNGGCLLSDTTMEYPIGEDVFKLIDEVKSKTISTDFDEQLDVSEKLYGENIRFSFTKNDVKNILASALNYDEHIRQRVQEIIYHQMNKYSYLFSDI